MDVETLSRMNFVLSQTGGRSSGICINGVLIGSLLFVGHQISAVLKVVFSYSSNLSEFLNYGY